MTKIKEIFTSIQGEGRYVGYKQLFVRFCGCNLGCRYCDTDFSKTGAKEYSVSELIDLCNSSNDCHSVSLTGGEPLLSVDFLKEFTPKSQLPIYLETNATMYDNLKEIIDYITYISADIKLPSSTGLEPLWDSHKKFFEVASQKELFAKVVFDSSVTDEEIVKICNLGKEFDTEIILQPKMVGNISAVDSDFIQSVLNKCLKLHHKTRLIPQTHKFIGVQ